MITVDALLVIARVLLGIAVFAELFKKKYQEAAFLALILVIITFLVRS